MTTKKGRQLCEEKNVHPQTKSWLRLWLWSRNEATYRKFRTCFDSADI